MTDLPPAIAELLTAWTARDWYALAVVGVVLVMRGITNTPQWALITRRWEWLPPVLLGSVAGLADAYYSGAPWRLAVLQAFAAGLQIGLGAIGVHHAWKRINDTRPPRWRGFPVLLLGIGASGCASSQREACYALQWSRRLNATERDLGDCGRFWGLGGWIARGSRERRWHPDGGTVGGRGAKVQFLSFQGPGCLASGAGDLCSTGPLAPRGTGKLDHYTTTACRSGAT